MRPRLVAAFLLALISAAISVHGNANAAEVFKARSLYRDILVYEEDDLRCMKFGYYDEGRQSCIRLSDRDNLVFDYTKMIMGALYLNPAPTNILIIGLGGGTLPSSLRKLFPASKIDCVEIDPMVVNVSKKYFYFAPTGDTKVFEEDGRVYVKHALQDGRKYDLIILDAFDREYIPEHMLTKEFLQEVKGLLTDKGVLASNTFSASNLYDHESATYYAVFGDFYRLKLNNRVILLQTGGLPDKATLARNAALLEDRLHPLGTGSDWILPLFEIEKGWPKDTRILTDQYSPSNLLNGLPAH